MNKKKGSPTFLFIGAILFNLIAVIIALSNNDTIAAVWMCLGTTFFCLGCMYNKKGKD